MPEPERPEDLAEDFAQLAQRFVDDFLFLVQKRSSCVLVREVLPSLLVMQEHAYRVLCVHDDESAEFA